MIEIIYNSLEGVQKVDYIKKSLCLYSDEKKVNHLVNMSEDLIDKNQLESFGAEDLIQKQFFRQITLQPAE